MRKSLLALSALALPLAACAQEEAPPEADPTVQEVEEPAMALEGEAMEGEAPNEEATEAGATEEAESSTEETDSEEKASE